MSLRCTTLWRLPALITTNCCVLAVTILVVDDYGADVEALGFGAAYIEALICAIGAGVGFMLAMVMFSGVRKRVEACDPPAPFKGLPITLLAAAITSLSSWALAASLRICLT